MSLSDSTLGYPGGGGGGGGVNKTRHLPSSRPPFLTPERQHPPIINLTIIDPPESSSTLGEIFCPCTTLKPGDQGQKIIILDGAWWYINDEMI